MKKLTRYRIKQTENVFVRMETTHVQTHNKKCLMKYKNMNKSTLLCRTRVYFNITKTEYEKPIYSWTSLYGTTKIDSNIMNLHIKRPRMTDN